MSRSHQGLLSVHVCGLYKNRWQQHIWCECPGFTKKVSPILFTETTAASLKGPSTPGGASRHQQTLLGGLGPVMTSALTEPQEYVKKLPKPVKKSPIGHNCKCFGVQLVAVSQNWVSFFLRVHIKRALLALCFRASDSWKAPIYHELSTIYSISISYTICIYMPYWGAW